MLYDYVALLFFIAFAVFIPVSFVITTKLLGKKSQGNAVKNAPYESGEETIGSSRDVDNEYLPYFMIFLPFEIIIAILILWSLVSRTLSENYSFMILGLGVFATIISFVAYRMVGVK